MFRQVCRGCSSLFAAIAFAAVVTAVLLWSPPARADDPINQPDCDCEFADLGRTCPTTHGTSSCDINAPDCSVCGCVVNGGSNPTDDDPYICIINTDPGNP